MTFSLPQEFTKVSRPFISICPTCGGDMYGLHRDKTPDPACESCFGYGGDMAAEDDYQMRIAELDGDFNVANGNGYFILQDVLNIHDPECWGEISPSTTLMRIATYYNPENGVTETTEEQGVVLTSEGVAPGLTVIRCGRSLRQVESYVSRLKRLAEIAVERGCNIQWS